MPYSELSLKVAQALIDTISWLLVPFATILVIEWVIGLFRNDS